MATNEIVSMVEIILLMVSIITVWYYSYKQLKEIKNEMWLATFSNYTERYQNIINEFPIKVFNKSTTLTDVEMVQNLKHFRAYFNLCSEEFYLNREGKIDKEVWYTWEDEMLRYFKYNSFKQAWTQIKNFTCYDDRFISFVENGSNAE